jgi:hypothetical protein
LWYETAFTPRSGAASRCHSGIFSSFLIRASAFGIDAGESLGDRARHLLAAQRIEIEVRIAERVQFALGPVLAGRNLERLDVDRRVDVGRARGQDLRIARDFEERRKERVFETEPLHDQRVGAVQLRHEAGLHGDLVGVLAAAGDRDDLDALAADLARHVRDVRKRRDDAQHRCRGLRREEQDQTDENATNDLQSHGCDSRGNRSIAG